jgi:hypothetical protein
LLSDAYSIAAKGDNTMAKLESLLFVAREFVALDRDRGFDILSEVVKTANRIELNAWAEVQPTDSSIRLISSQR